VVVWGPPASLTKAAVSPPADNTTTTATAVMSRRQLGAAASRVRAAAPHCRHQSCSEPIGVPHNGQGSLLAVVWSTACGPDDAAGLTAGTDADGSPPTAGAEG